MTIIYVVLCIVAYLFLGGIYAGYYVNTCFPYPEDIDVAMTTMLWPVLLGLKLIACLAKLPYRFGQWLWKKIWRR